MQYRSPVGRGPSSKTCPRCAPQFEHSTSVRRMKRLRSSFSATLPGAMGAVKLGQPVPDSNFVPEAKRSLPQTRHVYTPASWWSQYSPLNGRSVPFSTQTRYWSGVSRCRSSDLSIDCTKMTSGAPHA